VTRRMRRSDPICDGCGRRFQVEVSCWWELCFGCEPPTIGERAYRSQAMQIRAAEEQRPASIPARLATFAEAVYGNSYLRLGDHAGESDLVPVDVAGREVAVSGANVRGSERAGCRGEDEAA